MVYRDIKQAVIDIEKMSACWPGRKSWVTVRRTGEI